MIVGQELETNGDEMTLRTHINSDDIAKENWQQTQQGKGFIKDEHGHVSGRLVANIPAEEAAMLQTVRDIDYLSFTLNGDKAAFRRLLQRFPHWRCAEGRI